MTLDAQLASKVLRDTKSLGYEFNPLIWLDHRHSHVVGATCTVKISGTHQCSPLTRQSFGKCPTITGVEPQIETPRRLFDSATGPRGQHLGTALQSFLVTLGL